MSYIAYSKNVLKENGYRLTQPREAVLTHLQTAKKPMNAYDLGKKIKESGETKVDTVTIYRILKVYLQLGLIHETRDGYISCQDHACSNQKHCHHQFICKSCDNFQEIHLTDQKFLEQISQKFPQLAIKSHHFEFFGLCESCQTT